MKKMKPRSIVPRIVSHLLCLALALPSPAFALRQTGLEESDSTKGELVAALTGTPKLPIAATAPQAVPGTKGTGTKPAGLEEVLVYLNPEIKNGRLVGEPELYDEKEVRNIPDLWAHSAVQKVVETGGTIAFGNYPVLNSGGKMAFEFMGRHYTISRPFAAGSESTRLLVVVRVQPGQRPQVTAVHDQSTGQSFTVTQVLDIPAGLEEAKKRKGPPGDHATGKTITLRAGETYDLTRVTRLEVTSINFSTQRVEGWFTYDASSRGTVDPDSIGGTTYESNPFELGIGALVRDHEGHPIARVVKIDREVAHFQRFAGLEEGPTEDRVKGAIEKIQADLGWGFGEKEKMLTEINQWLDQKPIPDAVKNQAESLLDVLVPHLVSMLTSHKANVLTASALRKLMASGLLTPGKQNWAKREITFYRDQYKDAWNLNPLQHPEILAELNQIAPPPAAGTAPDIGEGRNLARSVTISGVLPDIAQKLPSAAGLEEDPYDVELKRLLDGKTVRWGEQFAPIAGQGENPKIRLIEVVQPPPLPGKKEGKPAFLVKVFMKDPFWSPPWSEKDPEKRRPPRLALIDEESGGQIQERFLNQKGEALFGFGVTLDKNRSYRIEVRQAVPGTERTGTKPAGMEEDPAIALFQETAIELANQHTPTTVVFQKSAAGKYEAPRIDGAIVQFVGESFLLLQPAGRGVVVNVPFSDIRFLSETADQSYPSVRRAPDTGAKTTELQEPDPQKARAELWRFLANPEIQRTIQLLGKSRAGREGAMMNLAPYFAKASRLIHQAGYPRQLLNLIELGSPLKLEDGSRLRLPAGYENVGVPPHRAAIFVEEEFSEAVKKNLLSPAPGEDDPIRFVDRIEEADLVIGDRVTIRPHQTLLEVNSITAPLVTHQMLHRLQKMGLLVPGGVVRLHDIIKDDLGEGVLIFA
ncbi:MAG: hypothetical protein HYS41_04165 [Candidatus Omnitrophica bacterium]|nr:hypothetical protein [Candidatus Omnitrophota bacterium]